MGSVDVMEAARVAAVAQRFAVAGMLGAAAAGKVASGRLRGGDLGEAFTAVLAAVPRAGARAAARLVILAEAGVAVALLVPGVSRPASLAAAVLAAGFVGFLLAARRLAPGATCGCLGGDGGRIGARSVARAAVLGLLALCGAAAGASSGWAVAAAHPVPALAVLAGDAVLLLWLSPEAGRLAGPSRLWAARRRCRPGTLERSLPALRDSPAYEQVATLLTGRLDQPADHWSDGCWHFVSVPARYAGRPATAVFAVPTTRAPAGGIRTAVVSDATRETLYAYP